MKIALTTIYILNCFFLLMVVLLQAGRGGGLSLAGGGGSAQVFGSRGATTVLQKLTGWSAAVFMGLSMVMAAISSAGSKVEEGVFLDPETFEEDGMTSGETSEDGAGLTAGTTGAPVEEAPLGEAPVEEAAPTEATPETDEPAPPTE